MEAAKAHKQKSQREFLVSIDMEQLVIYLFTPMFHGGYGGCFIFFGNIYIYILYIYLEISI